MLNKEIEPHSDSIGMEKALEHDPQKWVPVCDKDHAQAKKINLRKIARARSRRLSNEATTVRTDKQQRGILR
jgi:hypothetical protein